MKSTYQVIPRKYRPQCFKEVVGQEPIVQTLKNALKFERLAQAYLFCGSRGTGKTTLARLFAKALNCQNITEEFEPCGKCSSCEEIASSRALDVLEIDGASNRGIDDMRQLNETVGYATNSSKYKIYIIDEVHMLTKEAFNALLKTLEEPPKNVKFFFATTEPHKILPTIISRCQRFDLQRIPVEKIKEKLGKIAEEMHLKIEESALQQIAAFSEGSLRDAESLLDQLSCYGHNPITSATLEQALGLFPRSHFFELDRAISKSDLSYAFELAQKVFLSGTDFSAFMDALLEHFRQLLWCKTSQTEIHALSDLEKNAYLQSAALYTKQQCLYIIDSVLHWQQMLHKSAHKRIYLEMLLIQLMRSAHQITLDHLVHRLIDLEKEIKKIDIPMQKEEAIAVISPSSTEPLKKPEVALEEKPKTHPSKYETLIRFAAVELEGVIHK